MKPWKTLAKAAGPNGEPIELAQRGDEFVIRANGRLLMSSRQHRSEEQMADALPSLNRKQPIRVLVGGLGLGFTLRAVLNRLKENDTVEVAELSAAVVEWNRTALAHLAGSPLDDPRVTVRVGDVRNVLREPARFDAVLLDVDNGPEGLTVATNNRLYSARGLQGIREALLPKGIAVIWSASRDSAFEARLRDAGFAVECRAIASQESTHCLFVGKK